MLLVKVTVVFTHFLREENSLRKFGKLKFDGAVYCCIGVGDDTVYIYAAFVLD